MAMEGKKQYRRRQRKGQQVHSREREERLNFLEDVNPDPNIWNTAVSVSGEKSRRVQGPAEIPE